MINFNRAVLGQHGAVISHHCILFQGADAFLSSWTDIGQYYPPCGFRRNRLHAAATTDRCSD
jgi:hypothetical protein